VKFLVASLRSELLPLAHQLRSEGHEVETLVWRARYETAWDGEISKLARHTDGTLMATELRPQVEQATSGELSVITTVRRVAELFHAAKHRYVVENLGDPPGDVLHLGGWFDGERISAPHLLVSDWGAWTGGQGPRCLGGLTLLRLGGMPSEVGGPRELPQVAAGAAQAATERMKSASFQGLFHFAMKEDAQTGAMQMTGLSAGWPWLQTQAFLAEMPEIGSFLSGGKLPELPARFVTVIPVSIPPYPNEKRSEMPSGVAIEGLTPQQQGRAYWFDIRVDHEARKLRTAGLDGLLCVATGASNSTPALARARALELAQKMQVPEKQYRMDAAAQVDAALCTLEERWGIVV